MYNLYDNAISGKRPAPVLSGGCSSLHTALPITIKRSHLNHIDLSPREREVRNLASHHPFGRYPKHITGRRSIVRFVSAFRLVYDDNDDDDDDDV